VSEDAFDELEKMLASLFGEQMASDAVGALRSSGVDPSSIAQMPGVGDISQLSPAQLLAMRAQFQQMFSAPTPPPAILICSTVSSFHNARTTTGDHRVSIFRQQATKLPSFYIIFVSFWRTCRSENCHPL